MKGWIVEIKRYRSKEEIEEAIKIIGPIVSDMGDVCDSMENYDTLDCRNLISEWKKQLISYTKGNDGY